MYRSYDQHCHSTETQAVAHSACTGNMHSMQHGDHTYSEYAHVIAEVPVVPVVTE